MKIDKEKDNEVKNSTNNGSSNSQGANSESSAGSASSFPIVDFSTFVLSIASSALVQLGDMPDPTTGQNSLNLDAAKHTIDMLAMLQEKTVNNLTEDEKKLLDGMIYELRMKFVMKK